MNKTYTSISELNQNEVSQPSSHKEKISEYLFNWAKIAGCALNKLYKFFTPLLIILLVLEFIMIIITVSINLWPF